MIENSLDCQICNEVYNESDREPYVLTPCGHPICKKCADSIWSKDRLCPFDRRLIKSYV